MGELSTIIGFMKEILTKRKVLVVLMLIATILTSILTIGATNSITDANVNAPKYRIVLDAGHGGLDGGCVGVNTGVYEKTLNLDVVKKLERYFNSANFSVVLTRDSDAGLYTSTENMKKSDMLKRKEIIEKSEPSLVISVHMNKYPGQMRRGAQVFYKKGCDDGERLATCVQKSFNEMDTSIRDYSALTGDYYLLNVSPCPAIIAECGFLSNPEEELLLVRDEYRESIAYAIFKGTVDYLSGLGGSY